MSEWTRCTDKGQTLDSITFRVEQQKSVLLMELNDTKMAVEDLTMEKVPYTMTDK